jgi:hypothetical protein
MTKSLRRILAATALALPLLALPDGGASAQVEPPLVLPPATHVPPVAELTFEDRVAGFLTDFYLFGEDKADAELESIYAPVVDYFGKPGFKRSRVLADKRAYFARWPRRAFRLHRDTLVVVKRTDADRSYDVRFEYDFEVSSASRTSRGRGIAELTLDLALDGGRIVREGGRVLARR